jgi:hypothetical protein
MKPNKKPWPLRTTYSIRNRINTNPDFQRPAVWGKAQKQLLIDTVLRDYDVPKLYWRRTGERPDRYDVVDGQQRLRAIWEFFGGKFRLPKDADLIDGYEVAGCDYESLPDDLRIRFDTYALDVVVLEDTDEDEVREMFLRLQNGTSLKAQEKRNAMPGQMRAFVKELAAHPLFLNVGFSNTRFNFDLVAAQVTCLELAGGPTNVRSGDLTKMYKQNEDFDAKGPVAKAVRRTLGHLASVFQEKTPELERYNVIALYCVVAEFRRQYVWAEVEPHFQTWFLEFEKERREQEMMADDDDSLDPEWRSYKEKISHSTDAADSIRYRMDIMLRRLLQRYPTLSRKDNQRDFTSQQRLAIFRRDGGHCQIRMKCHGDKVTWDDWHCDHHVPWSKGGQTTVDNGVVACTACNLCKGHNQ